MRDLNRVLGSQHFNLANFWGTFSDLHIFSDQLENIEIALDRFKQHKNRWKWIVSLETGVILTEIQE